MATVSDAELVMKLYDLRREKLLREAREFVIFKFQPKDLEELQAAAKETAHWRQTISYWEMAASLVMQGALDPALFLESNGEGIFIYTKFHPLHAAKEKEGGSTFMPQTAGLIERYPAAKARHEGIKKALGQA